MSSNYSAVGMGHALERSKARRRRSQWIVIGSLVALVALICAGVAIGVTVSKKKSSSSSSSHSSNSDNSSNNSNGPTQTDPNDPSSFVKNDKLRKSFYGMAYTPENSLFPDCGNSLKDVIRDIQLLSQLTTRVRLYGADCNQTAMVLEAIKQTKVDLKVYAGNYVLPSDDEGYQRQRKFLKDAIQTYGSDNIAGITVGNEFMLNYLTGHQATDPNGPVGQQGATILLNYIKDTRSMLQDLGATGIAVGNSDAGSFFSNDVLSAVDYGMSNVHAWFANTTINDAAPWVFKFFDETNVQPAALLPNKPKMYIAETGWPTKSSDVANANNGFADASVPNLQTFLDTFVCKANQDKVPYFYFEFFDEKWKDLRYGGVEGWWGLFNGDRTLKDITIPDCTSP